MNLQGRRSRFVLEQAGVKTTRRRWAVPLLATFALALLPAHGQQSNLRDTTDDAYASKRAQEQREIVVGFVGGFVKHDDARHPEVRLAERLGRQHGPGVDAEVFENRHRERAFRKIVRLLDANRDGVLTADEKRKARIIIYGHSWGGSETVMLARELEREGIPVLLTIQVDSIQKPGEDDSAIPANVKQAINFYQTQGPLHGRREIHAVDPARTKILGNLQMGYGEHPVNCDDYPWFARTFTRSHIEIENDPRVWDQVSSLIDAELPVSGSTERAAFR